jgi:hypothetical protein
MMARQLAILTLAIATASACAPAPPPPPAAAQPVAAAGPLRAVFHLSDPSRSMMSRGLTNAQNALKALGDEPARFVLVVHGQALLWLRRGEPENLGPQVAALLATGKVDLRICKKTLEENHWRLDDMVPGVSVVDSGTLEVLRLQREGYAYFQP